ncbi:MAG TPA: TniQ family protein [Devosia sp.]|nr:TniQ family protein [Devosia sp.]
MLAKLTELKWRELEPAHSYASRLAAHYGCSSVNEFLSDFEINDYRFAAGQDHEVEALALLTGTDQQSLRIATPKTKTGTFAFGTETFSLYYSRRKRIAICVECISEDIKDHCHVIPEAAASLRQPWLLSPIMTCSKHRRPLTPSGATLKFDQRYDYAFRLDGIAERLPKLLAETTRRDESEFECYVCERLLGNRTLGCWLDALGLNELFGLCANLGLKVLDGSKGFLQLEESEQHAAYQAGFAVLKGGRESLRDFFNHMIRTRILKLPLGPASLLGRTYTALLGSRASWLKYAPVLEELANAVYDVLPIGPQDAALFGIPIGHRRLYNISRAGAEFGITPKTLLGYAEANGAASITDVRTQHGPRKWITIDAASAERLFREPFEVGWRKRLRGMGMSASTLNAVLAGGLLRPLDVKPAFAGFAPVRVGEVDALMEGFLGRAELVEAKPVECARLLDVSKCLEGTILLHRQILEKKMWVGRLTNESRPYASIVVRRSDVDAALLWPDHFSFRAASDFTSLDQKIIYAAWRKGWIVSEEKLELRSGQMKPALARATVETLSRDLIGLIQLAGGTPRRAGTLRRELEAKGISPAIVIERGARAYFREQVREWLPIEK